MTKQVVFVTLHGQRHYVAQTYTRQWDNLVLPGVLVTNPLAAKDFQDEEFAREQIARFVNYDSKACQTDVINVQPFPLDTKVSHPDGRQGTVVEIDEKAERARIKWNFQDRNLRTWIGYKFLKPIAAFRNS